MRTQGGDEEVLSQVTAGQLSLAFREGGGKCLFQQPLNLIEGVEGDMFLEASFPKIPLRNVRDQMD